MTELAECEYRPIAYIHTTFPEKFGIPRQSGLVETEGRIIFTPEFRTPDAIRGIDLSISGCFGSLKGERRRNGQRWSARPGWAEKKRWVFLRPDLPTAQTGSAYPP